MNQALLHQLTSHPEMPLGWLIQQTKAGTSDNDVRRTWILFGDPSLKFQFMPSSTPEVVPTPPERGPFPGLNHACLRNAACAKQKEIQ
jgi:hypothetical protein